MAAPFPEWPNAKLAPFLPTWGEPFTAEYQYRTEIIESRDGTEQRRALRQTPRRTLGFASQMVRDRFHRAHGFMAQGHSALTVVPDLHCHVNLVTALASGAFSVTLASIPGWLKIGRSVLLDYRDRRETRVIGAVAGNTVTFVDSGEAFPVGSKLYLLVGGRFQEQQSYRLHTDKVGTLRLEFAVLPGIETEDAVPAAPDLFEGVELYLKRPNWAEPIQASFNSPREVVDYGQGRIAVFTPIAFNHLIERHSYIGRSYEEALLAEQFFRRQRGQRGSFFMPTWTDDIPVGAGAASGDNTLSIPGTQFAQDYAGSRVHQAVTVLMRDGSLIHRRVTGIAAVGGNTVLTVAGTWGQTLSPATVSRISWLLRTRCSTDTLTMEWITDSVAQYTMTFRSLTADFDE